MSGSSFGKLFRITTWGESHGAAIGVVIDGCPAGLALTADDIQVFLDRRKPGQSKYATKRQEGDTVEILSGIFEGRTTGTPISLLIRNQDQRSHDYGIIVRDMPTIHMMQNMVSAIIVAAVALPVEKQSAAPQPEQLLL